MYKAKLMEFATYKSPLNTAIDMSEGFSLMKKGAVDLSTNKPFTYFLF